MFIKYAISTLLTNYRLIIIISIMEIKNAFNMYLSEIKNKEGLMNFYLTN